MNAKTLSHFYLLADTARAKFGDNAPKITDDILRKAFPDTVAASENEGCDKMLRVGVKSAVQQYIRKPLKDTRQRTLNDIDPDFLPVVEQLGSLAYFVPADDGGEYVGVPDLCHDRASLDAARKFMRIKGNETLAEADRLDQLYNAIFG